VFGAGGAVAAAISISGTTAEITNENLVFAAGRLVECAASISALLHQE
jgi:DNA-binding IclR family transcriptional regulator